ncbi:MAG: hypothetical protein J5590_06285 [Clostridia bacterium]|nr:hypothetical protein [Clostridia bacterium]
MTEILNSIISFKKSLEALISEAEVLLDEIPETDSAYEYFEDCTSSLDDALDCLEDALDGLEQ